MWGTGRASRDGWRMAVTPRLAHAFNERTSIEVEPIFESVAADEDHNASRLIGVGTMLSRAFGGGIAVSLSARTEVRRHAAPDPLFGTKRVDRTLRVAFTVRHRSWRFRGFAPYVGYSLERTRSMRIASTVSPPASRSGIEMPRRHEAVGKVAWSRARERGDVPASGSRSGLEPRARVVLAAPPDAPSDNAARIVEHPPSSADRRPAMTRSELRARVAAAASLSKADAAVAAGAVFSAIADALARGETVTVAGFGKFTTRDRPARAGRNPQTGEAVAIAVSRVPSFKAGKALRDTVNA